METSLRERLLRQARFLAAVRRYFSDTGYAEVDTPVLSPFLIPEPAIEIFRTDWLPAAGPGRPMWLAPSPELWMKRLLARGSGSIFQVSRSFRNGDLGSPLHNPEFRLLEWYTLGASYLEAIAVTEGLFSALLSDAGSLDPDGLEPPFRRLTMEEAFRQAAGIELGECQETGALKKAGERAGAAMPARPTWEEAFHIAFLTLVEPGLPRDRPLVLMDYPRQIPTTARPLPGTPWAQRWELYVRGVEIANCYTEETDAAALRALFGEEEARGKGRRTPHDTDWDLAEEFPPGFPSCTGTALGLDRLEMVMRREESLQGVILFPFSAILPPHSAHS
jgi:lysyl-tRNA synthetase class 2